MDGLDDSLVAHVVTMITPTSTEATTKTGATFTGKFMTGYSANWSDQAGYYNEYLIDYDDSSVQHMTGSSVTIYETSKPGGRAYSQLPRLVNGIFLI